MSESNFRFGLNPIQSKVFLSFSLITLIMVAASVTTYVLVNKLKESGLRENVRAIQQHIMDIKLSSHEFILKDRNNVFFFATGKSEHTEHYKESLGQYHQSFNNIKAQFADTGSEEVHELDTLNRRVEEFDAIFNAIELRIKERGTDSYGIIGDFEIALQKMSRFDYGSDNISLLRLKYFIQEYQLNGSSNTIHQVSDETYLFSSLLEKHISDQQVVIVVYALSDYESNFKRLVAIDSTLGLYTGKGLQEKLFQKMEEINELLPLVQTNALISSAYTDIVNKTMLSLFVATLLLGFLIIKFRERDLRNDKRVLELNVLERTLEIHNKNMEIHEQAEKIKGINQNLEGLVQERTIELERKNKALEEYAFITAHNLRAPVASILGLVNLTTSISLQGEDRNLLDHLKISAEKLDAIVHSITEAIEEAG